MNSVVSAIDKFIDAKYELGAQGPDRYDCVSVIYYLFREAGVTLPSKKGKWNEKNYVGLYQKNPKKAQKVLYDYFTSIGVLKDFAFIARYDLVLLFGEGHKFRYLLYLGNGNFWTFDQDHGAFVIARSDIDFDKFRVEVRQWV